MGLADGITWEREHQITNVSGADLDGDTVLCIPPLNGEKKADMVNHPPHYQSENGLEVISVIETFTNGLNGIAAVDTGNILKYVCRWYKKNGIEDLKKARWYLDHLIKHVEKENLK